MYRITQNRDSGSGMLPLPRRTNPPESGGKMLQSCSETPKTPMGLLQRKTKMLQCRAKNLQTSKEMLQAAEKEIKCQVSLSLSTRSFFITEKKKLQTTKETLQIKKGFVQMAEGIVIIPEGFMQMAEGFVLIPEGFVQNQKGLQKSDYKTSLSGSNLGQKTPETKESGKKSDKSQNPGLTDRIKNNQIQLKFQNYENN